MTEDGWSACAGCSTPNDCRMHGCGVTRGLWKAAPAEPTVYIAAANPETILRLVRVARAATVILSHHDEGARPDQIALDELRAALKETI
jgi:hypothetical protein